MTLRGVQAPLKEWGLERFAKRVGIGSLRLVTLKDPEGLDVIEMNHSLAASGGTLISGNGE